MGNKKFNEKQIAVERHIRALVKKNSTGRLPTSQELARTYHMSKYSVLQVIDKLRKEKLILVARKYGIVVACETPDIKLTTKRMTSAQIISEKIAEGIENGRYPVGHLLPKISYFEQKERVSTHTICKAISLLEKKKIIHRHMRGFAAGPGSSLTDKVILFFVSWNFVPFTPAGWCYPFFESFNREAKNTGTEILPIFSKNFQEYKFIISNKNAIVELVEKLGDRYMGTFFIGNSQDEYFKQCTPILDTARYFMKFGKPVVWFDFLDEINETMAIDKHLWNTFCGESAARKYFVRCHFDHMGAVRLALDTLYNTGHRLIGIPWFDDGSAWKSSRVSKLVSLAEKFKNLKIIIQKRNKCTAELKMEQITETVTPLLRKEYVSAIICLNDKFAHHCYRWLTNKGYKIPGDISVISFDANVTDVFPWRVSSIDFGFAQLGYTAFHCMAGDIPSLRKGINIPAVCQLNHKGSIR